MYRSEQYDCQMNKLMFQAGVKGMSERSELIPCIILYKCFQPRKRLWRIFFISTWRVSINYYCLRILIVVFSFKYNCQMHELMFQADISSRCKKNERAKRAHSLYNIRITKYYNNYVFGIREKRLSSIPYST